MSAPGDRIGLTVLVERMVFTFPIDEYNQNSPEPFLQRDAELFWKPKANVVGHNSLGFYGPEFSEAKDPSVFRIVCLGDSCTHFGPISYPDMLRAVLDVQAPGRFEVINAGVIGYTSYQGMKLLDTRVMEWSPDLVIVYFGWNDHWLSRGVDDKQQSAEQPSGLIRLLADTRVFQLANLAKLGAKRNQGSKMRVEPDDYHGNLTHMQRRCRQGGAEMWLVTAPHALDLGVPPYLLNSGEVSSLQTLVPLHEHYNEIVRRVGQQTQAAVVDVATEMDGMNKTALFIEDHIHLSDLGKQYLVSRLLQTLGERGILETPGASQPIPRVMPRPLDRFRNSPIPGMVGACVGINCASESHPCRDRRLRDRDDRLRPAGQAARPG